mmetsp:Transcript_48019/g.66680  ORF Transcript_48019/g.66680 Transcript_48019/m.66680 type:complete len:125 (+) Transcript_48019:155-529(+)
MVISSAMVIALAIVNVTVAVIVIVVANTTVVEVISILNIVDQLILTSNGTVDDSLETATVYDVGGLVKASDIDDRGCTLVNIVDVCLQANATVTSVDVDHGLRNPRVRDYSLRPFLRHPPGVRW